MGILPAMKTMPLCSTLEAANVRRRELGQFLTAPPLADFMAGLFEQLPDSIRLLDPGAGSGALTAAVVRRAINTSNQVDRINVTAYEIDPEVLPALRQTLEECAVSCERVKIEFTSQIHVADFVAAVAPVVRRNLFGDGSQLFNMVILNPPYRKIESDSRTRRLLRQAGIETSNLYAGFFALAIELLEQDGELVAITPRSFCNGPYFLPFRRLLLQRLSLRRLHVFESRSAAFRKDGVLQENLIVHGIRSSRAPDQIVISTSADSSGAQRSERSCSFADVVSPHDNEQFIHLVNSEADHKVSQRMSRLFATLADLGLDVSTGRVVHFRAREAVLCGRAVGAVPLIFPCHFEDGYVRWPKDGIRKPNSIRTTAGTSGMLLPNETYVLVRRFSAKEERRRVVACMYDPTRIDCQRVGFENHLNYFHADQRGIPAPVARGLTIFLNSTLVDSYFRQFNGHTQVNAADLRKLRYPTLSQLATLGAELTASLPDQASLDRLVESELF